MISKHSSQTWDASLRHSCRPASAEAREKAQGGHAGTDAVPLDPTTSRPMKKHGKDATEYQPDICWFELG